LLISKFVVLHDLFVLWIAVDGEVLKLNGFDHRKKFEGWI